MKIDWNSTNFASTKSTRDWQAMPQMRIHRHLLPVSVFQIRASLTARVFKNAVRSAQPSTVVRTNWATCLPHPSRFRKNYCHVTVTCQQYAKCLLTCNVTWQHHKLMRVTIDM